MARFGPDHHTPAEDPEGGYDCPDCDRTFESEHGRKTHRGIVHRESAREYATCEHCDSEFEVKHGRTGRFCSSECCSAARRERRTLTCEHCGDEFEVKPYQADQKYCSNECNGAAFRDRVAVTCANCGDEFEVQRHEASERTYCSVACRSESQTRQERRECAGCGRTFSTNQARTNRHCSVPCRSESLTSKPRPDDIDGLLWLLYVYEEHNTRETWLRANANLDPDDQLTKTAVKERLRENHWMRGGGVAKYEDLSIEDVDLGDDEAPSERPWQKYYRPDNAVANGGGS